MAQSRRMISFSALAVAGIFACSSALAMPFCGNKGYKNNYRYAPAYAYPAMIPGYGYAPMVRPHTHSWNHPAAQAPAGMRTYKPAAQGQVQQSADNG